ncbi:MAG: hypothetical protein R3E32_15215 [Chitinophagales bacterium]
MKKYLLIFFLLLLYSCSNKKDFHVCTVTPIELPYYIEMNKEQSYIELPNYLKSKHEKGFAAIQISINSQGEIGDYAIKKLVIEADSLKRIDYCNSEFIESTIYPTNEICEFHRYLEDYVYHLEVKKGRKEVAKENTSFVVMARFH